MNELMYPWTTDVSQVMKAYLWSKGASKHSNETLTIDSQTGNLIYTFTMPLLAGILKAYPDGNGNGWICEAWITPNINNKPEVTLLALHTVAVSEPPYYQTVLTKPRWGLTPNVIHWFNHQRDGDGQIVLHSFVLLMKEVEAQHATETLRRKTKNVNFVTFTQTPQKLMLHGYWHEFPFQFINSEDHHLLSINEQETRHATLWSSSLPHPNRPRLPIEEQRYSVTGKPWVTQMNGAYLTEYIFEERFKACTRVLTPDYTNINIPEKPEFVIT